MIQEKQDGKDLVWLANDEAYGGQLTEAARLNGTTGKLTATAGIACPGTLLQDTWDKISTDGSAAAVTAEHLIFKAWGPLKVGPIQYIPDAALTANDSNYATITVTRRNADGTGNVTVASVTTQTSGSGGSGNWAPWLAVNLALTAANVNLAAGQLLTISISKTGTGVVVPWGSLTIAYALA